MTQRNSTRMTGEAIEMELCSCGMCLDILSFDTAIAASAERTIEGVVMERAVWMVVVDVEVSSRKWLATGFAVEAFLVITTCETAICRAD